MYDRKSVRKRVRSRILKSLAYRPMGFSLGLFHGRLLKHALTVFVFHDITDHPSEFSLRHTLNVSPAVFEFQITFIEKNFNVIGPDELLKARIPSRAALITFDDGFHSFFVNAVPIFESRGVPTIIFLNMEPIMGGVFWAGLITCLCERRPDFVRFVGERSTIPKTTKPMFLYCSREIVRAYLANLGQKVENEVKEYVGEFATEQDLKDASQKSCVFYGNHLFNHYVPLLMSDEALIQSYSENRDALKNYPNYRDLFSFPFGQPGTCFSDAQVQLLLQNGAQRVFSSYPLINSEVSSPLLHRIPLTSQENSSAKMWARIFLPGLRLRLKGKLGHGG